MKTECYSHMTEEEPNKRAKAAELLATGLSVPKVAESIGVSRQTVYRWLKAKEYRRDIDRDIGNVVANAQRRIAALADAAADALESAITAKPGSIASMNAIRLVFEMAAKNQHVVADHETEISFVTITTDADGKIVVAHDPTQPATDLTNPEPK